MEYDRAIEMLTRYLAASEGAPLLLPDGSRSSFIQIRSYEDRDLATVEASLGCRLPQVYRRFMTRIGACRIFCEDSHAIEFPPIEELQNRYLEALGILAPPSYLPVAEDQRLQELAVFRLLAEPAAAFFNISHEYGSDDWGAVVDESRGWKRFEDWIVELVQCNGRTRPH